MRAIRKWITISFVIARSWDTCKGLFSLKNILMIFFLKHQLSSKKKKKTSYIWNDDNDDEAEIIYKNIKFILNINL